MKNIYYKIILILLYTLQLGALSMTYEKEIKQTPRPLIVHRCSIDPQQVNITLEHAQGGALAREKVSSIGQRINALVACNGGNYRRGGQFNGNSLNLLKINNQLYTNPGFERGSLAWNSKMPHQFCIAYMRYVPRLLLNTKSVPVSRINQPFAEHEAILYTRLFNRTTLTPPNTCEVVIENNSVIAVNNCGNNVIPKDGYVYAYSNKTMLIHEYFEKGIHAELTLDFEIKNESTFSPASEFDFILEGAGTLLKNSVVQSSDALKKELLSGNAIVRTADEIAANFHDPLEQEWLINLPHPRTAIGITSEGLLIIIVVEGRNPGISEGLTLPELAQLMKEYGCTDALNLGGGGDSALYIGNSVINICSGSEQVHAMDERPVSDAIVITTKKN